MAAISSSQHQDLAVFSIENGACRAEIATQGAHLTHWQPRDQQSVLWLSAHSHFQIGKAIRGGVPICFPWFGAKSDDPNAPMHGLARALNWELKTTREETAATELVFVPGATLTEQTLWPRECEVELRFSLGQTLQIEFWAHNGGASTCDYEIALHSYFAVGDVRQCAISGLENVAFFDKVAQIQREGEANPIRITGETDRVYGGTASTCIVRDPVFQREIVVSKSGSNSTVVWNPWIEKATKMPDFGDNEWTQMMCIETANVGDNRVRLEPNAEHSTTAKIEIRAL